MHQISFAPKLFLFLFAIFQAQLLPPPQRSTATLRQPPLATPHLKPWTTHHLRTFFSQFYRRTHLTHIRVKTENRSTPHFPPAFPLPAAAQRHCSWVLNKKHWKSILFLERGQSYKIPSKQPKTASISTVCPRRSWHIEIADKHGVWINLCGHLGADTLTYKGQLRIVWCLFNLYQNRSQPKLPTTGHPSSQSPAIDAMFQPI